MYEEIAWKNFVKTGDLESFLEYKRLCKLSNELNQTEEKLNDTGDVLGEFNKDQGNNNKRNAL